MVAVVAAPVFTLYVVRVAVAFYDVISCAGPQFMRTYIRSVGGSSTAM